MALFTSDGDIRVSTIISAKGSVRSMFSDNRVVVTSQGVTRALFYYSGFRDGGSARDHCHLLPYDAISNESILRKIQYSHTRVGCRGDGIILRGPVLTVSGATVPSNGSTVVGPGVLE